MREANSHRSSCPPHIRPYLSLIPCLPVTIWPAAADSKVRCASASDAPLPLFISCLVQAAVGRPPSAPVSPPQLPPPRAAEGNVCQWGHFSPGQVKGPGFDPQNPSKQTKRQNDFFL